MKASRQRKLAASFFASQDPSGKAFAGLLQQDAGGRAKQKELPRHFTIAAALVDHAAQYGEEFGHALHFVKDDQAVPLREQEGFRVVQLALRRREFQVEI